MRKRFYQALSTVYIPAIGLFTTVVDEVGGIYCYGKHTDNLPPRWEKLPPIPIEVKDSTND